MYVKGNANDVQTNNLDGEALFWVQTKVSFASMINLYIECPIFVIPDIEV